MRLARLHPWCRIVPVSFIIVLTLVISALPVLAQEFGDEQEGQRVYDRAELLTGSEIEGLESDARSVEEAGAPVVVYLQRKDASFDDTLDDARNLMDQWDVQSRPDARDGVIIFLNLEPDDPRRGQLAVVAGEAHFDGGNLPQRELDRITDEMRDLLSDDETAEGISTGLKMIAESLEQGPPPPPEPTRAEEIANDLGGTLGSPWNIIAGLVAAALGYLSIRVWKSRPTSSRPATPLTDPPGNLKPAIAGALVQGGVHDAQLEATILDLARRDALAFEPTGEKKVQVRLLDGSRTDSEYERLVWEALDEESNDDGVVTHESVAKVRSHWAAPKRALTQELEERRWFDPDAGKRRRPLYIAGTAGLVVAAAGVVIAILSTSSEPWALIGTGILILGGLVALITGSSLPNTTREGEEAAMPWRGYLEGLKNSQDFERSGLNLDEAVPYAVAMNASASLDKQLKYASEEGYSPLWLGRSTSPATWGASGFYPYWIIFHGSVAATASGGAATGTASTGSGGSGGSF